ncbi:pilus assembly protein CpaD [Novosphingobium sp. PhB165]|uniref:CpaD family pilus assembly protein n=1 Tax=Novosphingobium sp. PhB165 TaxID=2485105 RepID=UPI00104C8D76|nr:CpaD family pilus assembly protein [Novosphingobium sp. PhB165]TCM19424.1 pilus assembly protein CpaD [Novosphingobium sp. PhB165]
MTKSSLARSGMLSRPMFSRAIALSLGLALAGCGGMPTNRTMYSTHQPVVEKVNYSLDVGTGGSGLAYGEQSRLVDWFEAMGARYGDRIYVEDPESNPATRSAVEAVAGRFGLMLSEGSPATEGNLGQGRARIVLVRSKATVPHCPDWSSNSDFNPNNGLSSNFGCAVNSNLAAMVANPEDLVHGATGTTEVGVRSTKAIETFRNAAPTGGGGVQLPASSSKGD